MAVTQAKRLGNSKLQASASPRLQRGEQIFKQYQNSNDRNINPPVIASDPALTISAGEAWRSRSNAQNEPAFVEYVVKKLEDLRGERLEDQIEENSRKLFLYLFIP